MAKRRKHPEAPPPPDARLEAFLQQGASIIAVERGVNQRTRVKLAALARDLGLPEDQLDNAIAQLQAVAASRGVASNGREAEFAQFLEAKFRGLARRILSANREARLLQAGTDEFGIDEQNARRVIREVAAARQVQRISQSDSMRHISVQAAQILEQQHGIDEAATARLRAAGRGFGLTTEQVDAILAEECEQHGQRRKSEETSYKVLMAVSAAALAVVVCLAVWLAVSSGESNPPRVADGGDIASPPAGSDKPPTGGADWWDEELATALAKARLESEDFDSIYGGINDPAAAQRRAAYSRLAEHFADVAAANDPEDEALLELLDTVFAGCHALDPDVEAARWLRGQFIERLLTVSRNKLIAAPAEYRQSFRAAQSLADARSRAGLSDARGEELITALGDACGTPLPQASSSDELVSRCNSELGAAIFRQWAAAAKERPEESLLIREQTSELLADYLPPEEVLRNDSRLLAAALPQLGEDWSKHKRLIAACIASDNPLNALDLLRVYESTDSAELRELLAALLLERAGKTSGAVEISEVAGIVRRALGAAADDVDDGSQQRLRLQSFADEILGSLTRAEQDFPALLREAADLAYYSALACALLQPESGSSAFTELESDGPPSKAGDDKRSADDFDRLLADSPLGGSEASLTDPHRRLIERYIANLGAYQRHSVSQRVNYLRSIARDVERFGPFSPEQGADLAQYLLAPKPAQEQQEVNRLAGSVCRQRELRLALADQLATSRLAPVQLEQLVSVVLRREFKAADLPNWREAARQEIVGEVIADLSRAGAAATGDRSTDQFDRAATAMLEQYGLTARLLRASQAQFHAAESPAQMLRLAARLFAEQSVTQAPSSARQPALPFQEEVALVNQRGVNDLQRTVLIQRLLARLLVKEAHSRRPDLADEANQIAADLEKRDARAANLIVQLRDGEAANLRLWLLIARP